MKENSYSRTFTKAISIINQDFKIIRICLGAFGCKSLILRCLGPLGKICKPPDLLIGFLIMMISWFAYYTYSPIW